MMSDKKSKKIQKTLKIICLDEKFYFIKRFQKTCRYLFAEFLMILRQFCLSFCFYLLVSGSNFFMNFSVESSKFNKLPKVSVSNTKSVTEVYKQNEPV